MIANRPQRSSLYAEEACGRFLLKINYFFWFNKNIKVLLWEHHASYYACLFWGTSTDALTLLFFSGNFVFPCIAR